MYVDVVGSLVVIFQQTPRVERLQGCRFKMTEDTSTYHSERQSTELNTHFPSYRSWSPIRRWRCTYSNSAIYLLAEQITVLRSCRGQRRSQYGTYGSRAHISSCELSASTSPESSQILRSIYKVPYPRMTLIESLSKVGAVQLKKAGFNTTDSSTAANICSCLDIGLDGYSCVTHPRVAQLTSGTEKA